MFAEHSSDSIFGVDAQTGQFLYVNDNACRSLGYSRAEMLLLKVSDIQAEISDQEVYKQNLEIVREKKGVLQYGQYIRKNGTLFPVEVNIKLLEYKQKEYLVAVARDITERRQAEIEKKKLEEQLWQTQKLEAIGTLAGGVAHDFNNILFPIIGYTEMLIDKADEGSELKEDLEEILSGALKATDLVQQLLAFSRRTEKELVPLSLPMIVKEVLKLTRASLPSTIRIISEIDSNCCKIIADPNHIHQIAMNLITNAFHAMEKDGGTLGVHVSEIEITEEDKAKYNLDCGTYARLSVSDTGSGIEEKFLGKIFDPYFSTKDEKSGTGMGLSVVHGIIESYSGDISVSTEPGKGSQFDVYFPGVLPSNKSNHNKFIECVKGGGEHVLIVDDESSVLKLEKRMLMELGYQVTSQGCGQRALEIFETSPNEFDIIVTDLTMPTLTGDKLLKKIKSIKKEIPVILCTGFSHKFSKANVIELGFSDIIMKPVIKSELARKIRNALDKK